MKNQYAIAIKNFKRFLLAGGLGLLSHTSLFANQNEALFDAMEDKSQFILTEKIENGITKYFNKKGEEVKSHPVYQLSLDERVNKGYTSVIKNNKSNKTGPTVTLNVTFLDVVNNTDYGFDDPTYGADRRATVEKAVEYYANIICNTGSADIEIQESENISGYALAWGGQYYFQTPGFQDGTMFRHITTGVDPSSSLADGLVTYNFYYTFNDNYDETPTSNEYDLYTISLHELGHAFGFTSMIESDGGSQLASGVYSSYDEFLLSDDYGTILTSSGAGQSVTFNSTTTELTTDGVIFDFGNSSYGAVYSPDPFNSSSIDHFDSDRLSSGDYLMHPSLAKGIMVHEVHQQEAEVLEKIGYCIDYSNISSGIKNEQLPSLTQISMYPNPSSKGKDLTISVTSASEQTIRFTVYDILGNLVYSQINSVKPSTQLISLPISISVNKGTYMIQANGDEFSFNQMLIVE